MKQTMRMLSLLLAVLMLLTVIGCGKKKPDTSDVSDPASGLYPDSSISPSDDLSDPSADSSTDSTPGTNSGDSKNNNTTTANTTKGNGNTSSGDTNMKDPKNPYKDVPSKLKGTEVRFLMYWDPNARDKSKFRTFEKETGIKAKSIVSPDVQSKLASLIASQQAPDVVRYSFWPAGIDLLQDLSVAKLNMADPVWDRSVVKATTYKGKVYGINTFGETAINSYVAYNEDMFHDNGFDSPGDYYKNGNWNFETFTQACRDMKSINKIGYVTGTRIEWVYTAGIQGVVSWENGKFKSNLGDPTLMEGFRMEAQLKKEGLIKDDWDQNLFINEGTGMINTTNYGLEKEGFFKGIKFKMGAVPLPNPKGKAYDTVYGLDAFGVPQGASNPEGAGYFLRYYLDPVRDSMDTLFMSTELRDFHLNELKKANRQIDPSQSVLDLVQVGLAQLITWEMKDVDPNQVESKLNTYTNMVDKAVAKANARYR